jgi:Sec-independent protein secretion pathway component TatC
MFLWTKPLGLKVFRQSLEKAETQRVLAANQGLYNGFLSAGLIFELPMIAYILSKIGIISPEMLRKYRRHSIVVILVLAAALTPSTDPVSQLVFAAPLWVLYEISILVTVFARKKEESVTSIE